MNESSVCRFEVSPGRLASLPEASALYKEFKTRIDVLELEETLAVLRVLEEGWGGSIDFTDVLLLLKIDGQWKCVAKAYNQNSNTISK
ncbi:nuclear transport factor 2 family protein [Prevotella sp. E13-27]|uniref:nuclear transport factor 2 family protein n=1 Tax=Prevotella sp. E13-27 TaxID=2938122 RepID=UPI00200A68DE|nr:nuclear transport factor 2 family protein [Prevotella sp. E13-27]MCK8623232.1 nuclear transport factor 2 family protein [Prevotella sp. E13-27]